MFQSICAEVFCGIDNLRCRKSQLRQRLGPEVRQESEFRRVSEFPASGETPMFEDFVLCLETASSGKTGDNVLTP